MRTVLMLTWAAVVIAIAGATPSYALSEFVESYSYIDNDIEAVVSVRVERTSDGHGGYTYTYWVTVYVSNVPRFIGVHEQPGGELPNRGRQEQEISTYLDPNGNGVPRWNDEDRARLTPQNQIG